MPLSSQRAVTLATTWSSLWTPVSVAGRYGPGWDLLEESFHLTQEGRCWGRKRRCWGTAGGIQQDGLGEGVWERRNDTLNWLGREVGANCPGILTFLNSKRVTL